MNKILNIVGFAGFIWTVGNILAVASLPDNDSGMFLKLAGFGLIAGLGLIFKDKKNHHLPNGWAFIRHGE